MPGFHAPETDQLFETILRLETVDECYALFEDLCTVKELRDMSQRLQIARLLHSGMKYQEVSELTKVSSATISRVNRCLMYGSGGYRMAIDKMTPPAASEGGEADG